MLKYNHSNSGHTYFNKKNAMFSNILFENAELCEANTISNCPETVVCSLHSHSWSRQILQKVITNKKYGITAVIWSLDIHISPCAILLLSARIYQAYTWLMVIRLIIIIIIDDYD